MNYLKQTIQSIVALNVCVIMQEKRIWRELPMSEKQVETFRQYIGKRFDRMFLPVIISLLIALFDAVLGIVMLSVIIFLITMSYFPFRRDLPIVEPKKEENIYVYKWYYNRANIIRVTQALFLTAILAMTFTADDFLPVIVCLLVMVLQGAVFMYLSPKTMTEKTFSKKDVKDVFWLNRHTLEIQKSQVRSGVLFLSYLIGVSILGSVIALTFLAGDQYRVLSLFVCMLFMTTIVIELVFALTYGFEDFPVESLGEILEKTEPIIYDLEVAKPKDVVWEEEPLVAFLEEEE